MRRDKLLKELKDIYTDCCRTEEIMHKELPLQYGQIDVAFLFTLERFKDLIQKLEGTYKTLEEKLADIASKSLNKEPNLKTVQYKFKPVRKNKKHETSNH